MKVAKNQNLVWICAFFAGFGTIKLAITAFVAVGFCIWLLSNRFYNKLTRFSLLFFLLWITYLIFYALFYIPPIMVAAIDPRLDIYFHVLKSIPLVLLFLVVATFDTLNQKVMTLFFYSFGMFFFACMTTIFTLIYIDPPYYGRAMDWVRHVEMNSPGTTILAGILPILIISFFEVDFFRRSFMKIILIFIIFISLGISILFTARSFLLLIPALIVFKLAFKLSRFRSLSVPLNKYILLFGVIIITFVGFSIKYWHLFETFLADSYGRIINGNYSIKILHHIDYWNQVKSDFFIYPHIILTDGEFWFHNWIFDSHRTSGPLTAIIGYLIIFLTMIKVNLFVKRNWRINNGYALSFYFILPVLFTTIPWESPESQVLTFFAGLTALNHTKVRNR